MNRKCCGTPKDPGPHKAGCPQAFAQEGFSGKGRREPWEPDWTKTCKLCGATPIVPTTGMCGPHTFGEAKTAGGNW